MKSSVETRVAAAVTASFIALTLGAMAQENSRIDKRPRAQKNWVKVGGLTTDGSLADLAIGEARTGDYASRNESAHEDEHLKFEVSLRTRGGGPDF